MPANERIQRDICDEEEEVCTCKGREREKDMCIHTKTKIKKHAQRKIDPPPVRKLNIPKNPDRKKKKKKKKKRVELKC